jgi:tetratricopeptide (TPR) repeat protein
MSSRQDSTSLSKQFPRRPNSPKIESELALGNLYIEENKLMDALTLFERLIVHDTSQAQTFNSLGHVYFCLGHIKEALTTFQQAVALDPYLILAHQNIGYTYTDLERYDEAILAFRNAIQLEPKNARPYHGLGLVYAIVDDEQSAVNNLQFSIMFDPLYVGPRISLAAIYRRRGQEAEYSAQIQLSKPLMERQKTYTRARFAAVCGNVDEALDWLEKVVGQTPGYRWTIRHAIDFVNVRNHPRFLNLLSELDFAESS